MSSQEPRKRRARRGDDGISWDKSNKCYVGTISLGYDGSGRRRRRTVRGKTKQEVKEKLDSLHEEINAGIQTPATYTVKQCVADWLDDLTLDADTVAIYRGQAEKWIYPKIGATKLKDFKATDADRFFKDLGELLTKASLVKIKRMLVRSFRRAQKFDLIGKDVAELVDLPQGQPGRPSRAMTEEQASTVLKAASGQPTAYVKVVKTSNGRHGASHAASENGESACGIKPRNDAPVTETSIDLAETTCRLCRAQLGLDKDANATQRLEALFVLSITLGLRPGELRKLTWDHVDLAYGVIHVWRSASRTGETKTPQSKRSLVLPKRAVDALTKHRKRQAKERLAAGAAWHDTNLVFCHEDGRPVHQRRAQLAVQQGNEASGPGSLARPRGQAHRGLDHEPQRRPDPGDQRYRRPQVDPRHRDRLPARDRPRDPRGRNRHGPRLQRRAQNRQRERPGQRRRDRVVTWLVT